MTKTEPGYTLLPFPNERRLMAEGGRLGRQRHTVHGLTELDVTHARQLIRTHKERSSETLSFTAFIAACLGQAVESDKTLHACRDWRGRLVIFDDVDVSVLFEVEVDGRPMIRPHILRAVNRRTVRQLHDEIRAFQTQHQSSQESQFLTWFMRLPGFLMRWLLWGLFKMPHLLKQYYGTVMLTSVGMFGHGAVWGIPQSNDTLQIVLGGIAQKPAWVDGQVQPREYLSVTLSFDHDIVDGAPAARFTQRLRELIESGYGLEGLATP